MNPNKSAVNHGGGGGVWLRSGFYPAWERLRVLCPWMTCGSTPSDTAQ